MFGDRYFGPRYFGNRYFGTVAGSGPGPGAPGDRHEWSWGAVPRYVYRVLLFLMLT